MENNFSYYDYNFTQGGEPVLSNTGMSHLERSPAHFLAFLKKERKKDTKSMLLGRNIHTFILEPQKFNEMWQIKEQYNVDGKRNPLYQPQKEKAERGEIILIDEKQEFDNYLSLLTNLSKNNFFATVLNAAAIYEGLEKDLVFTHKGIPCKARLDTVAPMEIILQLDPFFKDKYKVDADFILLDLKTTQDARQSEFIYKATNYYDYDRQLAWYTNAIYQSGIAQPEQKVACFLLAVEKEAPMAHTLIRVGENVIKQGTKKYDALCEKYIEAKATNFTQAYEDYEWDCPEPQDYSDLATFDVADINSLFAGFGLPLQASQSPLERLANMEKDYLENIAKADKDKLFYIGSLIKSTKRFKGVADEEFAKVKERVTQALDSKLQNFLMR